MRLWVAWKWVPQGPLHSCALDCGSSYLDPPAPAAGRPSMNLLALPQPRQQVPPGAVPQCRTSGSWHRGGEFLALGTTLRPRFLEFHTMGLCLHGPGETVGTNPPSTHPGFKKHGLKSEKKRKCVPTVVKAVWCPHHEPGSLGFCHLATLSSCTQKGPSASPS